MSGHLSPCQPSTDRDGRMQSDEECGMISLAGVCKKAHSGGLEL